MARVILVNLFLFLLPFLIYGGYAYLVRKNHEPGKMWNAAPINWLMFAGALLMFGTLIYYVSFETGDSKGVYRPAIYKDGKLQEGYFEPSK